LYGRVERFLAILLEHCGGALPPWLAPVQVLVAPIGQGQQEAAIAALDRPRHAGAGGARRPARAAADRGEHGAA